MDSSFQLESSEHERIYSKVIEPTSFLDTSSVDKPRLVIVAAQTGAGKSNLVTLSLREFSDGNVVTVNTDELRAHQRYDEIVMLDDTKSAERTHHDASSWKNKLLSRCMETHRNVVMEGVFKDSKGLMKCYVKLLESVAAAEQQKLIDLIEVYNRNGTMLYSNELHDGDWKDAPQAVAVVEQERNRKLTDEERKQYVDSWPRVFEYMHKRGAGSDEIDRVKALAEHFIKDLERTAADA